MTKEKIQTQTTDTAIWMNLKKYVKKSQKQNNTYLFYLYEV